MNKGKRKEKKARRAVEEGMSQASEGGERVGQKHRGRESCL